MERGLRALRRGLRRAEGFALFIAVCNQPRASQRLIGLLEESMPDVTFHTVELGKDVEDPLDAVLEQLPDTPEGPVMVLGLERSNPSNAETRPVLYGLNLGRADWVEELPQPVVFWIPEYLLGLMGREAPDFLDWRSDTLHFPVQGEKDLAPVFQASWDLVSKGGDLSMKQRQRRIAELQSRLAAVPASMARHQTKIRIEWLLELSDHQLILGKVTEAVQSLNMADQLLRDVESEEAEFHSGSVTLRRGRLSRAQGEIQEAVKAFERAAVSFDKAGKNRDHAIALGELARLKAQAGDVQEALRIHEEQIQIFEQLGDDRERAVTLGDIARLKAQAGDVQEALRIHEEQIQIFERLGDDRERAVTLGDIARLKAQAGDVDVARELQEERLQVLRNLGDLDGIGVGLFDLAQLDLAEKQPQDALSRLMEAWKIHNQLGRADGIAVVGEALGWLLATGGKKAEAEQVLARSEAAFRKLGREERAAEVKALREGLEDEGE